MDIEDLAKRDLFDENSFEITPIYDPYRHSNILKDSNKIQEGNTRPTLKNFFQQKQKYQFQNKNNSQNNRHSLKRLLERLESLPSPQRKLTKMQNPKLKTICAMASTQPVIIKKNKSIFVKTINSQKNSNNDRQKLSLKICTPSSSHSSKLTSKRQDQDAKIRDLIKKKLAERNELKYRNKTDKIINFLRENNYPASIKKVKNNSKASCRKLINFLS